MQSAARGEGADERSQAAGWRHQESVWGLPEPDPVSDLQSVLSTYLVNQINSRAQREDEKGEAKARISMLASFFCQFLVLLDREIQPRFCRLCFLSIDSTFLTQLGKMGFCALQLRIGNILSNFFKNSWGLCLLPCYGPVPLSLAAAPAPPPSQLSQPHQDAPHA